MGEPYQSLLGHFRHEVGHYYWDVLVRDSGRLEGCRIVFGDDRRETAQDFKRIIRTGRRRTGRRIMSAPMPRRIRGSWAETWAPYLHIVDTLDMARAFGIRAQSRISRDKTLAAEIDLDPCRADGMQEFRDEWLPLTFAVNSLNRAMTSNAA
jgi:hypothetical protein